MPVDDVDDAVHGPDVLLHHGGVHSPPLHTQHLNQLLYYRFKGTVQRELLHQFTTYRSEQLVSIFKGSETKHKTILSGTHIIRLLLCLFS